MAENKAELSCCPCCRETMIFIPAIGAASDLSVFYCIHCGHGEIERGDGSPTQATSNSRQSQTV
jgi:hypothetical protein